MASVEATPRHLKLGEAQTVGSVQMAGSGECSRLSLPQLVRGIVGEVEEQGADLLWRISEQCSERHAQSSGSPLVIGAVVAVCLPPARPPQLAQNGAAPVCKPYPRWVLQKRRMSQLKLHVRSAAMSPRKREDLDAGG